MRPDLQSPDAGLIYFQTVRLRDPHADLLVRHIDLLRQAVRICRQRMPFHFGPTVILPGRIHTIWHLPPGDQALTARWKVIKTTFAAHLPRQPSGPLWQRRFWEQQIRTEAEYRNYTDVIRSAAVEAGLVTRPEDWPHGPAARQTTGRIVRTTDPVPSAPDREAAESSM